MNAIAAELRSPARVSFLALFLKVAFVIVLALIWGSLVIDQMPCFIGVPNCD